MNMKTKELLIKETERIEEDALYSMKGHYNAAVTQNSLNLRLGLPAAIIAGIAGGTALAQCPELAGVLAFITAGLTGAMTFLKPSEKSEQHKSSAARYHSLRNTIRRFREIEIASSEDIDALKEKLYQYGETHDELNELSPSIPRKAYELAKKDIDAGRAKYQADKGGDE